MKKILLALCALLLLAQAPMAVGPSLGAGAFGGMHFPLVQDDQGSGSTFGIRGIVQIIPSLSAEPNVTFSKYGEPDFGIVGVTNDLEGSKVTSFGVDALFGKASSVPGIRPFVLAGFGFYKIKRDQTAVFDDDSSIFGYAFGLGIATSVAPKISLDVRGKAHIIPFESGSSKKSVSVMAGLNYYFGVL